MCTQNGLEWLFTDQVVHFLLPMAEWTCHEYILSIQIHPAWSGVYTGSLSTDSSEWPNKYVSCEPAYSIQSKRPCSCPAYIWLLNSPTSLICGWYCLLTGPSKEVPMHSCVGAGNWLAQWLISHVQSSLNYKMSVQWDCSPGLLSIHMWDERHMHNCPLLVYTKEGSVLNMNQVPPAHGTIILYFNEHTLIVCLCEWSIQVVGLQFWLNSIVE